MNPSFRIAIAGLGTVGGGVVKALTARGEELSRRAGRKLEIVGLSARNPKKARGFDLDVKKWWSVPLALASSDADVVVELIGGEEGVARALVETALTNRKHVVTANKALLARHGKALAALAENNGVSLKFEAAAAGGIPIIKALRESLVAYEVGAVKGILNGTCNYILTEMEASGRSFADVLKEAQKLGYAEADPTLDVGGGDTAHKLALLSSLAFGVAPDLSAIAVEGIQHITPDDIAYASEFGFRIKLLGVARRTEAGLDQRVQPAMVRARTPLANVNGAANGVMVDAGAAGPFFFSGRGAGEAPTASAVIADIIEAASGKPGPVFGQPAAGLTTLKIAPPGGAVSPWYLRFEVLDMPGVLAEISGHLAQAGVSIESMIQRGRAPGEPVAIVMITHETAQSAVERALKAIGPSDKVRARPRHDFHGGRMMTPSRPGAALTEIRAAEGQPLDRAFALEAVRVTEAAAIAASAQIGRGNEHAADQAAVEAMRAAFNVLPISGTVVIGEGERDDAPMLYIGEKVGQGGIAVDIALDPLEGTTLTAKSMANALAVMAMAEPGTMLNAPDTYMDKIAIGPGFDDGVIDLDAEPGDNINALAKAKGVKPQEIRAVLLDRPRHEMLIAKIRKAGAAVKLIPDGDVAGVIECTDPATGVDIYIGQGGAPEGVLAAAALRCVGGQMQGRLVFRNDGERARAAKWGIEDLNRKYRLLDLVSGDVVFSATGVTDGSMLAGVHRERGFITTESVVMRSATGTVRWIKTRHKR